MVSGLVVAGCSVVGIRDGTEQPKYSVVGHVGEVEIRNYGPRIVAETTIEADEDGARSAGFQRVAGYIFGANPSSTKIAMTAPVAQSPEAPGSWVVRFFMPAGATMASLPKPSDPRVRLAEMSAETVGVLRFSGSYGGAALDGRRAALLATLEGSPWRTVGAPVAWFYDPPWTLPFLRRNEVAVAVVGK